MQPLSALACFTSGKPFQILVVTYSCSLVVPVSEQKSRMATPTSGSVPYLYAPGVQTAMLLELRFTGACSSACAGHARGELLAHGCWPCPVHGVKASLSSGGLL